MLVSQYRELGIEKQIDYDKFYLYSIITHSTAIEGSTLTEIENQVLLDKGLGISGKSIAEQYMNLDLKAAYEKSIALARKGTPITIDLLKKLSALVMKNTGREYSTAIGEFSSMEGDLRLLNVTAGVGGKSYMSYDKVPTRLAEFCDNLNKERNERTDKTVAELYNISFDAHYNLVTIHPWADGNGRMARLLMNHLQLEFGLIPSKVLVEDRVEYIQALIDTRESDDLDIFRTFMTNALIKSLRAEITAFQQSL